MPVIKREMAGPSPRTSGFGRTDGAGRPKRQRGQDPYPAVAMLSLPTLWTVFVVNFLSVGLIWAYVARSYPKLDAARFWVASAFTGAFGALLASAIMVIPGSLLPLLAGGTVMIFAAFLAAMGIQRFYGRPVGWRLAWYVTGLTFAALFIFVKIYDSMTMRVLVYSIGQSMPFAITLKLLMTKHDGRAHPGARLAGVIACLIIAIYVVRAVGNLAGVDMSFARSSTGQGVLTLGLIFLSMAFNFGFLLMAIDRLRNEVADLALLDDLTGVGNRRLLVQRLTEECARSERSGEPFALLVIDLDGFKQVNDTLGHEAGDELLIAVAKNLQAAVRLSLIHI